MILGASRIKLGVMAAVLAAHILLLIGLNQLSVVATIVNQPAMVLKLIAPVQQNIAVELPSQGFINHNAWPPSVTVKVPEFSIAPAEINEASFIGQTPIGGKEEFTAKTPLPANTLFYPRLRQKLRQLEMHTRETREQTLTTWTTSNGRKYVDMGDGTCIHTMGKLEGERQAQWSSTRSRCGKSLGEKMLDNLQHTLNDKY